MRDVSYKGGEVMTLPKRKIQAAGDGKLEIKLNLSLPLQLCLLTNAKAV
jgi:hypothetical protein